MREKTKKNTTKKNTIKKMTVLLLLAAVVTAMTGCGAFNDETGTSGGGGDASGNAGNGDSVCMDDGPAALAIIVGNHSNAQRPDYGSIDNWLEEVIVQGGTLRMIVSDGNPYGMNAQIDNSVFQKSLTDSTRQRLIDENLTALHDAMSSLAPKTEEADTLGAIQQAALFLQQADEEKRVLLILDSGLATTGLLDFSAQPQMLTAEPEDVAAALEKKAGLPDLTGVKVQMTLSELDNPQQKLSSQEQQNLAGIWTRILQDSGAMDVTVERSIGGSGAADVTWPQVSVIETAGDTAVRVNLRKQAEVFTEEELGFKPDSDQLLDEETAKEALKPVAEYMKENPERSVIILGSTATARDEGFCRELSQKRAEKVAQMLDALGADENRMETLGLGYEDPWHVEDLDGNGNLIEDKARLNRKVMVMDAESSEAGKL